MTIQHSHSNQIKTIVCTALPVACDANPGFMGNDGINTKAG